jgi:hypothetical protein
VAGRWEIPCLADKRCIGTACRRRRSTRASASTRSPADWNTGSLAEAAAEDTRGEVGAHCTLRRAGRSTIFPYSSEPACDIGCADRRPNCNTPREVQDWGRLYKEIPRPAQRTDRPSARLPRCLPLRLAQRFRRSSFRRCLLAHHLPWSSFRRCLLVHRLRWSSFRRRLPAHRLPWSSSRRCLLRFRPWRPPLNPPASHRAHLRRPYKGRSAPFRSIRRHPTIRQPAGQRAKPCHP